MIKQLYTHTIIALLFAGTINAMQHEQLDIIVGSKCDYAHSNSNNKIFCQKYKPQGITIKDLPSNFFHKTNPINVYESVMQAEKTGQPANLKYSYNDQLYTVKITPLAKKDSAGTYSFFRVIIQKDSLTSKC